MAKPLIIEDGPLTPEMARAFENASRNRSWFNEHVEELEVYKRYRGRYVAAQAGNCLSRIPPKRSEGWPSNTTPMIWRTYGIFNAKN